ncbi:hypothetical protein M430DRAFT_34071 [Amorphotheca resinae ATCC 22711]|jgi:hypothetical protein|uniref:Uncharacterized protein n=1 Tax=Amorphotheca resinae ATCC 22711 TaxID=857342 RepID=A0A2T3B5Q1_AMORE|nr:hypothetical protein M430DRAFT_34071 [Amorphotheca resinae ATCC 22711]PSS22063.1 hypothetical protein M430DRAFT_34071 [Amorphotheca resinae ATCC 22711]
MQSPFHHLLLLFFLPLIPALSPTRTTILTHQLKTRAISECPTDHWRPLTPYRSTAFPEPWWFLPESDEANQDHWEVTHPTLPVEVRIPDPLLPTKNETVRALYRKALLLFAYDEKKSVCISPLAFFSSSEVEVENLW